MMINMTNPIIFVALIVFAVTKMVATKMVATKMAATKMAAKTEAIVARAAKVYKLPCDGLLMGKLTTFKCAELRQRRFWNAIMHLYKIVGVLFPDMSSVLYTMGDISTTIHIGNWNCKLNGQGGKYVVSLESWDDDRDIMYFESFDTLVTYVKGVIAEQAVALTK